MTSGHAARGERLHVCCVDVRTSLHRATMDAHHRRSHTTSGKRRKKRTDRGVSTPFFLFFRGGWRGRKRRRSFFSNGGKGSDGDEKGAHGTTDGGGTRRTHAPRMEGREGVELEGHAANPKTTRRRSTLFYAPTCVARRRTWRYPFLLARPYNPWMHCTSFSPTAGKRGRVKSLSVCRREEKAPSSKERKP